MIRKRCFKVWLIGAYIGVLGIVGAQRDKVWAEQVPIVIVTTGPVP